MMPAFPIRAIHQIEITSRCNLRCMYCTHPKMPRAKVDMDMPIYERCLHVASNYARYDTSIRELNLAGIGESTMHPDFVRMVWFARERMPRHVDLILATNGLVIAKNPDIAKDIADTGIRVWVSLHRPERAGLAVEILRTAGIIAGISIDPSVSAVDWAGQVEWKVTTGAKGEECPWVKGGRAFVLSDGRLSTCCFDATGDDVLGHISQDVSKLSTRPYKLCANCHLELNIPGYAQREEVAA